MGICTARIIKFHIPQLHIANSYTVKSRIIIVGDWFDYSGHVLREIFEFASDTIFYGTGQNI